MKLHDLQYLPPVTLAAAQTVYRVQRIQARPGAASIGSLKMAPIGDMYGRFALATTETCQFAESPETAIHESLVRREAVSLSISNAAGRQLLCLRMTRPVQLLDLRQHVSSWPVLQSLRFSASQEIAAEAVAAGFEGIAYRSAQHHGQDCFVVFGASLKAFKLRLAQSAAACEWLNAPSSRSGDTRRSDLVGTMKTSAAGLVALRVEVSLREGRVAIRALYAAVQVRPPRRALCSRRNDDFSVSFGWDLADHAYDLAAGQPSSKLMIPFGRRLAVGRPGHALSTAA